jgi:hypothetical protein
MVGWWLVIALATPGLAAEPAALAPVVTTTAPRPFTPDQIRQAMPIGTRISLRIEAEGQNPTIERWTVTDAGPEACTIASMTYTAATGALLKDEGARTSSWPELADHASFPAAETTVVDGTFTGDIGTHAIREYRVHHADGAVWVYRFAVDLPGPPAEMLVEKDGKVTLRMTQVLRQPG